MLKFTFKFIKSLSVFFWRVLLIISGIVFHSIGNAVTEFIDSTESNDAENNTSNNPPIITDELSAIIAFHNGEINEAEMQHYYDLEGERR